jgi:hypothetical protein
MPCITERLEACSSVPNFVPIAKQTIHGLGVRSALVAYAVWFVVGGPSGCTLPHEIGHALLHEQFDNRALAELEAESMAYVI